MEIKEKVSVLITGVEKTHKYSMSQIYGLYNEVFGVAETPQSCASCLIRKVNQLKAWLKEQEEKDSCNQTNIQQRLPQKRGRKPKQH